jgi:dTDP-4-dehydrorhamnose reductase
VIKLKQLLIIGGDSTIGDYLYNTIDKYSFKITRTTRNKISVNEEKIFLDLQDIQNSSIDYAFFDIVIFCAAITSVAECEKDPKNAYLINHSNTINLVKEFVKNNVFVMVFSTTQVFCGKNKIEYLNNQTNPISIYGKTKQLLEYDLVPYLNKVSILRCTKVISKNNNLFTNWLTELNNNKLIFPFDNIYFAPISIEYLKNSIIEIINKNIVGLNNLSSNSDMSFSDAAFYLCEKLNLDSNLINPKNYVNDNSIYISQYSFLKPTLNLANIPSPISALDYYIRNKS